MSRDRYYHDMLARKRSDEEDWFFGTPTTKECSSCHGVGEIEGHTKEGNYYTCPNCQGKGYIRLD